ncbi:MAG: DNA-processing protein DprA, partial [Sphingobium sp.]
QKRFDAIRLARSPRIGPVSYRQLIARFGDATEALRALPGMAQRGGGRFEATPEREIAIEIARAEALGARHLVWGDADYPNMLAETPDAPPVLTWRGDLTLASGNCVAMVGARNASAAARRFARGLAQQLAAEGVIVVSGLARGIDGEAHQGALGEEQAGGATIGVIASGIDIAYPPEHADLQEKVATRALLIAEQPPRTAPLARHFPHRNRIIAGLCRATIVVEAAPKSGSLITARLAGDYGREVLAVPGSPLDPRAQGCNQLIREGATLIQTAADVLEAISHIDPRLLREPCRIAEMEAPPEEVGDGNRADLDTLLGPVPVAVDELVRQSGLAPAAVQTALLEMELAGRLERHSGGKVSYIG